MSDSEILYDVSERIATITMNRPDRLNAYTGTATSGREVIDELAVLLANFSGRSE